MKNLNCLFKTILVILALAGTNVQAEILVIVHKSNATKLSNKDLKNIYLGKTRKFPNGKSATPFNLKYEGAREKFEQKVLKKNKASLGRYWSKRVFTGKGKPPKEVNGDEAMISAVASNKSGIGYVQSVPKGSGVKVLMRVK